jgi:DNA-binding Lrp family transcriptional regulator
MHYGAREKLLLRALSENARATVTELAKIAGCSRTTAAKLVEGLTKELDIRFTLEIDMNKLSILERHLIIVKLSKKPSGTELEDLFRGEKHVHDVYLTEGNFDLVVVATASNPVDYITWETSMIEGLSEFAPVVKPSDIAFLNFGFVPLNDSFVEDINKEIRVDDGERKLLRILNHNCRISYRKLAEVTGISEDMVRYKVFNLKKKGIIKRFTIAVQKPPHEYTLAFLENWVYTKGFDERAAIDRAGMMNADAELPLLTTFQLSAPLTGSFGNFAIGLFNSRKEAMQKAIRKHKEIYEKDALEIKYARIVKVLKGMLPFRNLDIKTNYMVVRWS